MDWATETPLTTFRTRESRPMTVRFSFGRNGPEREVAALTRQLTKRWTAQATRLPHRQSSGYLTAWGNKPVVRNKKSGSRSRSRFEDCIPRIGSELQSQLPSDHTAAAIRR